MSDLSPEDRALVDRGGRDDMPGAPARDRVRQRLALRLGAAAGLGAATAATKTATAMALSTKLLLAIGVVGVVCAGGAAIGIASRSATPAAAPPSGVASAAALRPVTTATTEVALAAPPAVVGASGAPAVVGASGAPAAIAARPAEAPRLPTAPATPPTTRASAPPGLPPPPSTASASGGNAPGTNGAPGDTIRPTADALAEETRLLRDANAATRAGQSAQALALLGEHERRFPHGVLAEERDAERVLALCAAGRAAEGRLAASRFLAAHPRSALAGRVRAACSAP